MDFFDLHCDTAYEMYVKNKTFYKNDLAVSGQKGECFENWVQTFAIWLPENVENPYLFYKNALSHLKENLTDNVKPVFAVEGGTVLEDNAERLYELKNDGVRFLTLTWNGENLIAGGCHSQKGLTDFGKSVIKIMNKLSMAVDVSHLNDKSFYSVVENAEKVLATHSNCRSICDVPRNLKDDQIKLIAARKGIIGLNFYPAFLGGDFIEKLYENIYYLCNMGFENNIAIGTDFDGARMDIEASNISKIPQIFARLEQKGLKKELLYKIFFKNANDFVSNL